jgi:flagellar FliL protein
MTQEDAVRATVISLILLVAAVWPSPTAAQDAASEKGDGAAAPRYLPLEPAFVTNFGAPGNGRLYFLKADVSLRVSSQAAAAAAGRHMPALRNALVLLLSRQEEATVATGSGREAIRAEALAELRAILEAEEGEPFIDDVLFTNFLVQR